MPKPATRTTDLISHEVTNSGIHLIKINDGSRAAIASLIAIFESLYSEPQRDHAIFALIDSSEHALPIIPSMRQTMQLEHNYPNHPAMNAAVLLNLDIAIMGDTLLRPLRTRNSIRLFTPKDRDRALEWLASRQAMYAAKRDQTSG
ncbi:MAG: hypothetical protein KF716_12760 [Anaerolineae bacterium]|nr:hypothetical protein [Anaerolineae bacterium]